MNRLFKVSVTLALVLTMVFAFTATASAAGTIPTGTYKQVLDCSSQHTTTAILQVFTGNTRGGAFVTDKVSHTNGKDTNYICTRTVVTTMPSSSPIGVGTYGSAFDALANNLLLKDSVDCAIRAGETYKILSKEPTGGYKFRASFPGATLYENVERCSGQYGVEALYYQSVQYVPCESTCEITYSRVS